MINKTNRAKLMLIFFMSLTLVSLLFLYYLLLIPVEETSAYPSYTYDCQGTYDCIATLKPNTVYDNRATLELHEGSYYRRVIDHIDVNFSYAFEGDLPANFTLTYSVNEYVQLGNWKKQIKELPQQIIETTGNNLSFTVENISTINPAVLQQLASKFAEDTGLYAGQYSLNVTTEIYIEAETSAGTVQEFFTPKLRIESKSSASEGEIISISGLEYVKTGDIEETEYIYRIWVAQQRNLLYAVSTTSLIGLVASSWYFIKTRLPKPPKPEKILEDFIGPYEELIVEAAQGQIDKEQLKTTTTITVNTLEDLVKIADTIDKPIIHMHIPPETHIFSIIDGLTKYEFTTTVTMLKKSEVITEEEEEEKEDE